MKKSILEMLYDGKITPWERKSKITDELNVLEQNIENEKQYFLDKLSPDDYKRLEKLLELCANAATYEEVYTYSDGFAHGALIMQEVMEKKEELICE